MAVSSTVTLPAQPAAGSVTTIGLAGNGYAAPHSETRARVTLDGAAGGGLASIQVNWDTRWVSLVSWATFGINGLSSNAVAKLTYTIAPGCAMGAMITVPTGLSSVLSTVTWTPTPQLCSMPTIDSVQPNFLTQCPNIDGDDYQLDLVLYNFKKDVLQVTPLSVLLASLPRGGNVN